MRKQLPVSDSEVVSDATTSFHLFSLLLAHLVYLLDSLPLEHSDILYIFLPRAQPTLTATSSTATAIVQQLSFFFRKRRGRVWGWMRKREVGRELVGGPTSGRSSTRPSTTPLLAGTKHCVSCALHAETKRERE